MQGLSTRNLLAMKYSLASFPILQLRNNLLRNCLGAMSSRSFSALRTPPTASFASPKPLPTDGAEASWKSKSKTASISVPVAPRATSPSPCPPSTRTWQRSFLKTPTSSTFLAPQIPPRGRGRAVPRRPHPTVPFGVGSRFRLCRSAGASRGWRRGFLPRPPTISSSGTMSS